MAACASSSAIANAANSHAHAARAAMSLAGHAMDRPDGAPALAARALPVMGLGAKAAPVAAIHRLPFQQFGGEVAQYQEIVMGLALHLVHGGVDQRHQAAHRRTLAQLRG